MEIYRDLPQNYTELVQMYTGCIKSVIFRHRIWNSAVDDMFQDVVTRLIDNDIIGRYHILNEEWVIEGRKSRPFRAYLITTVRNHLLNQMSKINRNPNTFALTTDGYDAGDGGSSYEYYGVSTKDDPLEKLIVKDTFARVRTLGIKYGTTILQDILEGKTSRQIAMDLKVPIKTVEKSRLAIQDALTV